MNLSKVIKDLYWIGKHYGMYLTLEEMEDYLRDTTGDIRTKAMLGFFGTSTKDGKYNAFNVIYWNNGLDNEDISALNLVWLKQARKIRMNKNGKQVTHKRGGERTVTTRKNGLLMCYVYMADGSRKAIYDRDEALLKSRADLMELEEEQKQLLNVLGEVAPAQLEQLSKSLTVVLKAEQEKVKHPVMQRQEEKPVKKEKETIETILSSEDNEEDKVPTFKEAFQIWTVYLRNNQIVSNQSVDKFNNAYKRHYEKHKEFCNKPIDEITTNDVHTVLRFVINSKVTKIEFNIARQIVRDTLGYFISEDEYDYDINVDFEKVALKLKSLRRKFIPKQRVERAIENELRAEIEEAIDCLARKSCIKKARYYLIKLNFYLGLREAELGALTVDDFDLERDVVLINKAEIQYRDVNKDREYTGHMVYEIAETKTPNGVREIPLIKEAHDIALELLDYHKRRGYRSKELIYDGEKGPMRRRAGKLASIYEKIAKQVGITKSEFRSHLQRKTFATHLVNHGIAPADIQGYLGHSDIMTTMRYYVLPAKLGIESKRAALQEALSREV